MLGAHLHAEVVVLEGVGDALGDLHGVLADAGLLEYSRDTGKVYATKLLEDNRDILEAMKDALMEYETIDSKQIDDIMNGQKPALHHPRTPILPIGQRGRHRVAAIDKHKSRRR